MKIKNTLGLSWANMKRRKARTALTALGIIVGIMAMVSISSLSGGFESQIYTQLTEGLDMDILTVLPAGGLLGGGLTYVTENESQYIANITGVEATLPIAQTGTILYNEVNDSLETRLIGLNFTEFNQVYGHKLNFADGRFPDQSENESCVLGYVSDPFAQVGENITAEIIVRQGLGFAFMNITFNVSGVFEEAGQSGMLPIDRSIFISIETYQTLFDSETMDTIVVKISDPNDADSIAEEIRDYYEDQVLILVPSDIIATVGTVFDIIEIFLLAIASIALLVAGISILNIMLVTVMERTREIGIMKALGATDRTILTQFLAEAVLLGILGGIMGIIFGWGLAYGMGLWLPSMFRGGFTGMEGMEGMGGFGGYGGSTITLTPVLLPETIIMALGFAVLVGVIFALYPAWKAAKLDPVQALRYE